MKGPPRHRPPPRFHAALGYVATADFVFGGAGLAVALGLTFAPHTHIRPLTPAEIHTTGAPPTVTTGAVSTAVAIDGGKAPGDTETPVRACRCTVRTPQEDTSWPSAPAAAAASGPAQPKPTAAPVTTTSGRSTASTVTAPPGTASTPQESPRETEGAFSGTPQDPSGTPGSSTPIVSTPSTQNASPTMTLPEGTAVP